MAEYTSTKLNAESHLLLDQPLLRLPYELRRKNFAAAQRYIKHDKETILSTLSSANNNSINGNGSTPEQCVETLDSMLTRLKTLKRKLSHLHDEERALHAQQKARIQHLDQLYQIPSLSDVKYEQWSRVRLDRLLVDYLLRMGYGESARQLAVDKGIEELVDVDAFLAALKVERALKEGRVQEALAWCGENRVALKKIESNLEYELRLQQYIELLRSGSKLLEATLHARKYLASHPDSTFVTRAAGLLAFGPETKAEPYQSMYSATRWDNLAGLFLQTHHTLFSLPPRPLLHIALSAGLSALKTPSCHSAYASSVSNTSTASTSVCPICSTELNDLARNVPYAHHTKSHVENDPVILPNGRIYGRERLMAFNEKLGSSRGMIRDPVDVEQIFEESMIKKVFIL